MSYGFFVLGCRDGYTDIGGRFDYASSNTKEIKDVEKFALFVSSDEFGLVIKEAQPPSGLAKVEGNALELKSRKHQTHQDALQTNYRTSIATKKEMERRK